MDNFILAAERTADVLEGQVAPTLERIERRVVELKISIDSNGERNADFEGRVVAAIGDAIRRNTDGLRTSISGV